MYLTDSFANVSMDYTMKQMIENWEEFPYLATQVSNECKRDKTYGCRFIGDSK